MTHATRCRTGFLVAALAVAAAPAFAQEADPRLARVLTDWERRQQAIDAIRYEVKGQQVTPRGSLRDNYGNPLNPPAPAEEIAGDLRWSILLDLRTGRHRREVVEQVYDSRTRRFHQQVMIDVCNGSAVKSAMPRDRNTSEGFQPPANRPDLVVVTGNLRGLPFQSEYMPLFFAHGVIRTMVEEVVPGKLRARPNPEYLMVQGQGVHAGKPCVVVRTQTMQLSTTSYDEFWIDPARDSAIVRYVMYSGKKMFNDIDIQYQQTPRGWLPERWTFTHYTGTAPTLVYRMRVESWQADPPESDDDFDIKAEPGMLVEERAYGASEHPLVDPKSATRVYRYGAGDDRTEVPDPFGRPRSLGTGSRWYWVGGAVLAAVVLALAAWAIRRRRDSAAA